MGEDMPAGDAILRSRLSLFLRAWCGRIRSRLRFEYIEGDAGTAIRALRQRVAELEVKLVALESQEENRKAEILSARLQVEIATEAAKYAVERLRAITAVEIFNRHGAVIDPDSMRAFLNQRENK